MFIGDDTIPAPDLIERHMEAHRRHPEREAGVVGFVRWDDSVAENRINTWLEWSGTQTWYASLAPEGEQEVSHWHFYTSNVSLKRDLLLDSGAFDEDFPFAAFEDIECAIRLSRLGFRLYYEPAATCSHLHDYTWPGLERRFAAMALSERLMVEMHPDVAPGCLNRMKDAAARPALPLEPLADAVPARLRRLERFVRQQANRHYHRRLAPGYMAAWDRAAELCELRRYLGDSFDSARLVYGSPRPGEPGSSGSTSDGTGSDEDRLFDLAGQALSGTSNNGLAELQTHLRPGSKVLDYRCGIGSAGLCLAEAGYSVQFADHPGQPLSYLSWRLAERGDPLPVYELDHDALPRDLDAAFCLDASGRGRDPVETLRRLEEVAPLVALRVAADSPGPVPDPGVGRLVARHALPEGQELVVYRRMA